MWAKCGSNLGQIWSIYGHIGAKYGVDCACGLTAAPPSSEFVAARAALPASRTIVVLVSSGIAQGVDRRADRGNAEAGEGVVRGELSTSPWRVGSCSRPVALARAGRSSQIRASTDRCCHRHAGPTRAPARAPSSGAARATGQHAVDLTFQANDPTPAQSSRRAL